MAKKPEAETITAVKGFSKDLKCRDFQYEIGKTYEHKGKVERCNSGFHSVEMPLDVFGYYPLSTSRYCEVTASGQIDRETDGDTKIASARITINAEIHLSGMIKRAAKWIADHANGNTATGDYGHAAATGHRGHAAATGSGGHAAATGDRGHAAATGKHSIAASLGRNSTAMAGADGWIVLAYWNDRYELELVRSAKVGTEGIEPNKAYRLSHDGKFIEVMEE